MQSPRLRIDRTSKIIDVRRVIPIKEIEANPHESFEMHEKMGMTQPRVSDKPIEVFDKRSVNDTYQIIDGHRRVIQAKKEGKAFIKAWVTLNKA